MHGVRRVLLERQAESLGLPLHAVLIPPQCINAIYEAAHEGSARANISRVACAAWPSAIFFSKTLRVYREKNLAQVGMEAIFPIWKRDTRELARDFVQQGFPGDCRLRRSPRSRSLLRGARTGRIVLRRFAAGSRSLRRERRIPHLCFRRPDFQDAHSIRDRRKSCSRRILFLRFIAGLKGGDHARSKQGK